MPKTIATMTLVAAALLAGASAIAEPATGSAAVAATPSGYSGPSSVPLMSVKQLLDNGRDDQLARLQGRIVSHDGGNNYTFADDSGRIAVEISAKRFPAGQTVSAEQRVELHGELEKERSKLEFEVKRIVLMP